MSELRLPDLAEGLEEAEVVAWLVSVGDTVTRDQPLVTVETDKAVVDVPSPVAGRIAALHGEPGQRLKVGSLLVEFANGAAAPAPAPSAAAPASAEPAVEPARSPRVKAAPAVRKLAVELGVELSAVTATGPDGRVLADDVRQAAAAPAAASATETAPAAPGEQVVVAAEARFAATAAASQELRGLRRRTAEVVAASWSTIPHIANLDEVDATRLLAARAALEQRAGEKVGLFPLLVMATVRTVRRFPSLNATFEAATFTLTQHEHVNLGIAVATPDGLVVPVVRHADQRGLRDLAAELNRLVTGARARSLAHDDLTGGTFTVTNFGALGRGRFSIPIIKAPEVAIVGFGAIAERPLVVKHKVKARPALPYSITVDHRVADGDTVTAFADALAAVLRDPVTMLLDG